MLKVMKILDKCPERTVLAKSNKENSSHVCSLLPINIPALERIVADA